MNIYDEIGKALTDSHFYEENKDLDDRDEIIKAVQSRVPEASAEDVDVFLTQVSETLQKENSDVLSEEDLEDVSGGLVVTIAVIGVVCKCIAGALVAGGAIGTAIWYWKNRNRKK